MNSDFSSGRHEIDNMTHPLMMKRIFGFARKQTNVHSFEHRDHDLQTNAQKKNRMNHKIRIEKGKISTAVVVTDVII